MELRVRLINETNFNHCAQNGMFLMKKPPEKGENQRVTLMLHFFEIIDLDLPINTFNLESILVYSCHYRLVSEL